MKKGIVLVLLTLASLYLPVQHCWSASHLSYSKHYTPAILLVNQSIVTQQTLPTADATHRNAKPIAEAGTNPVLAALLLLALLTSCILCYQFTIKLQNEKRDKKKLLEQLERMQAEVDMLRGSNKSKERMLSIVAHDLRSPLATLKSILDLRESKDLSKDEFDEILPLMSKEVKSSLELTEEVLYWAKSQMGDASLRLSKVNINQVLEEQASRFETAAKSKGITLKVKKVTSECFVVTDINMLKTILRNLLGNAIKFCRPNDSITLCVHKNGKATLVEVSDTGVGIPPENLSKLFGSGPITTKGTANEKGSGLGLTLCKYFVEKNCGKIWAESEPGKGSRFYFTLPQV